MASREDWIGRTGLEWARRSDALERLLGPAGDAGINALAPRPGEQILDLGCGAGASTEALAQAVAPGGMITGLDISPDLMALARERLAQNGHATLIEADAERHDFGEMRFDALYSRFGAMFFDNPMAAFANIRGAMKPGSRAVFVSWREPARNQWASVPMTFAAEGVVPPGPPSGPGPFSWADPAIFRPVLQQAGFRDISESTFEFMAEIREGEGEDPLERAAAFMLKIGPLAARLRGASEEAKQEAKAFLLRRLARHVHNGAVRLLASAWIIEARI